MSTAPTPFTMDVGFKAVVETVIDGVRGLLCKGYASLYGERDRVGETMLPGAFADAAETMWGSASKPPILWHHGLSALGMRPIGYATKYHTDDTGLWVEAFIPAEPPFKDSAAVKLFRSIYSGIKSGAVNGYSVGGMFTNIGKALVRWSLSEVSITPTPCQDTARFTVGAKALTDAYGAIPPSLGGKEFGMMDYSTGPAPMAPPPGGLTEQNTLGVLSRPAYGTVMKIAQQHKARALHDHLLREVPPELSGPHNAEDCPICADRRMSLGVKDEPWAEHGIKAVTKSEPDGDHPKSHYLYTPDDMPSHWKLRYKDADGNIAPRLLGACHAALTVGYRGNKVDIPEAAKQECLAKLKALYAQEGLDWPEESSGQGAKAIEEAQAILARYTAGVKAGRRFSATSTATITKVIDMLKALIAEEQAEEQEEAPATQ